jgi:hypothetical protein
MFDSPRFAASHALLCVSCNLVTAEIAKPPLSALFTCICASFRVLQPLTCDKPLLYCHFPAPTAEIPAPFASQGIWNQSLPEYFTVNTRDGHPAAFVRIFATAANLASSAGATRRKVFHAAPSFSAACPSNAEGRSRGLPTTSTNARMRYA